jgi:hypothetical protein
MGIEPIWNLERPSDPEVLKNTMIAHAPHLFQGFHWGLMGDGHFEKLTQAQLDERLNPADIAK